MLGEMLANRWRWQEWAVGLALIFGVSVLVDLSGGHLPWWAWGLAGVGGALIIDVAQALARRRERAELVRGIYWKDVI